MFYEKININSSGDVDFDLGKVAYRSRITSVITRKVRLQRLRYEDPSNLVSRNCRGDWMYEEEF